MLEVTDFERAIKRVKLATATSDGLLHETKPGAGGEIQLTDGILALLKEEKVFGYTFEGKRYDAGDKLGMLQATVEFALKRSDLGPKFREFLKGLEL